MIDKEGINNEAQCFVGLDISKASVDALSFVPSPACSGGLGCGQTAVD